MTLTNSTVTGNGASNAIGGGIVNQAGTLTLTNVTLDANLRGGLETDQGASTSVQNTILGAGYSDGNNGACVKAGRTTSAGGGHRAGDHHDLGNNLVGDTTCAGLAGSPVDPAARPGRRQRRPDPDRGAAARQPGDRRRQRQRLPGDRPARRHRAGRARTATSAPSRRSARSAERHHRRRDRIGALQRHALGDGQPRRRGRRAALRWGTSPTALTETSDSTAAGVLALADAEVRASAGARARHDLLLPGGRRQRHRRGARRRAAVHDRPGPAGRVRSRVTRSPTPPRRSSSASIPSGAATNYVISYDRRHGATETVPVDVGSAPTQSRSRTS